MKKSSLLLIPVVLVTGITLFYAWTDWSGARQLKATLAMLESKNESICVKDLLPTPIPDARNVAAAPIFKLHHNARLHKIVEPWKTNSLIGRKEKESFLHFRARQISPSFAGDDASAATLLLQSLEPEAPLLTEVREALARPEVVWPLDYSVVLDTALPYLDWILRLAQLYEVRALAEMAAGSPDRGFEDIRTMLALAKISKEPHFLIGESVEISILNLAIGVIKQGLDHHVWSDIQLAMFSRELAQPQLLRQCTQALRLERAGNFELNLSKPEIWSTLIPMFIDRDEKKMLPALKVLQSIHCLRPEGWNSEDKSLYALTTQKMIDSLESEGKLSSPEIWDDLLKDKNNPYWGFFRTPVSFLRLPSVASEIKKICKGQTLLNSLRIACAVERYRLANHQLPTSLDELIRSLLPSIPPDPMTGGPLLYKPRPDGSFVIYGLGWNRKDEGGPKVSSYDKKAEEQSNWGIVVTTSK